jgi:hypothetical protein
VLTRLLFKAPAGGEEMAVRSPCVRRPTRHLTAPEALCRNTAVAKRTLELCRGLLVQQRCALEVFLRHRTGSSSGLGTGRSSANRAYATLGSLVSSSTPAPYFNAVSFTG